MTDSPELQAGIEARRDRYSYHFDYPSSFDTPALVPHFFEQRYVADNLWFTVTARYTVGVRWETTFGATPAGTRTGDDYDTFVQPDGTIVVAGTTGGISIRSLGFSQRAQLSRFGPVTLIVGYRLRIDRSNFQLGHKTVTRNGALSEAFDVTTRETTGSQVHETELGVRLSRDVGFGWNAAVHGTLAPTTLGRLSVQLPDKYPGQDLQFRAAGAAGNVRMAWTRPHDRWPLEVSLDAGHIWSYSSTSRLARDLLGFRVTIGR